MGILFILKSKQPADPKFEELKRRIIEHLKAQDKMENTIEKGGMAIGTIREWKGNKYIKGADNKWRRYYNKETRGAKVSIKRLIKKVQAINSPEELIKLVLLHRDRFSDDNGHPIPLVQELSKYVSERQGKLAPEKPAAAPKKTAASKQPEAKEKTQGTADDKTVKEQDKEDAERYGVSVAVYKDAIEPYIEGEISHERMIVRLEKNGINHDQMAKISGTLSYENPPKAEEFNEKLMTDEALKKEESEKLLTEMHQNRSDAMRGNKNAYKGGPKPETKKEIKAAQEEEKKARKKAKMPDSQEPTSAIKDSTWDPKSEDYRFKDTGYIAGSRKELAQAYIKRMAREGLQVTHDTIDWENIEENERVAEDMITKQNLMGKPDWETLKTGGLKGNAGYLINEIYKTIPSKPEKNTGENRFVFSLALDAIRSRLESCKTLDDLREAALEIDGERTGYFIQATRTPEYLALVEKQEKAAENLKEYRTKLGKKIYERCNQGDPFKEAKDLMKQLGYKPPVIESLFFADGSWGGTYYSTHGSRLYKLLLAGKSMYEGKRAEIESNSTITEKTLIDEKHKIEDAMSESRQKTNEELRLTNPMKGIWQILGNKFADAMSITGNNRDWEKNSFAKHNEKAHMMEEDDFSWAEKRSTGGGGGERQSQFELLVADKIVRKGGRAVKVESTEDLKKAFNLRDVQSGNWVLNDVKSAKFHVENIAMGLADLADVTGIPDNLVSLNGRLAMAIGARGHNKFLAHYESLERVINITKMKGGGSLAHEWFHAFDNLIAEAMTGGKYNLFLTETNDEDLTDKQRKLMDNLRWYKRGMKDGDSYYRSAYEMALKAAKKAGIAVDELDVAEEHVQKIKGAFKNLVRAMKAGKTMKPKVYSYTKQDYEAAQQLFRDRGKWLGLKEGMTADEAMEAKQGCRVANMTRERLDKLVAVWAEGNPKGGTVTTKSSETSSDFYVASMELDHFKEKGYWSSTLEMAARAFAAYIDDKLVEKGQKNTYLTARSSNDDYKEGYKAHYGKTPRPYPEGEERKAINAAFDELFKIVKETGAIRKAIMAEFVLTLQKSEGSKLNYFKKLVLDHLNTLEEDGKELKKSLIQAETAEINKSGRGLPVGTIRDWKGNKYIKTAPGKWKRKYDSHTRGAKMAIGAIKKKVAAAKTESEMLQIINDNKARFSDSKGKPLPFVEELHNFVQHQAKPKPTAKKEPQKKPKEAPKWENPLAKYPKIDPVLTARTIGNVKYQAAAETPEGRRSMVNDLIKKYGVTKKDAEAFVDVIKNATDDDRLNAREFADDDAKKQATEKLTELKINDKMPEKTREQRIENFLNYLVDEVINGRMTASDAFFEMQNTREKMKYITESRARAAFGLKPGKSFHDAMREQLGVDIYKKGDERFIKNPKEAAGKSPAKDLVDRYHSGLSTLTQAVEQIAARYASKKISEQEAVEAVRGLDESKMDYAMTKLNSAIRKYREANEDTDKSPAKNASAKKKKGKGRVLPDGVSEQDVLDTAHDIFKKNPKITLFDLFRAVKTNLGIPKDNYDYDTDLVIQDDPTFTRIPIGSWESSEDIDKQEPDNKPEKESKGYTAVQQEEAQKLIDMAERLLKRARGDHVKYSKQWQTMEDHIYSQLKGMGLSHEKAKDEAFYMVMRADAKIHEEERRQANGVKKAVTEVLVDIFGN
ncbi:LPD1 domain-containing protein [Treponema sp. R6D11]